MTNSNILNIIDEVIINKKCDNKFKLVYDYTIEDSVYEDEPYYDDDYYKLYYNGEELLIYDEEEYPSSITIEICNISKFIHIIIPFIDDSFRNAEIFKQGVEYVIETINAIFTNTEYEIDIYYEEE